ncbi:MAG: hypothetical protein ACKVS6_08400 [Planctomycetota bacterium]
MFTLRHAHPRSQSLTPVLAIIALVLACAAIVRSATPSRPDPQAPSRSLIQPFRDDYEYSIFKKRGAWAGARMRPYLDVFSEYPPLATWAVGVPYFFITLEKNGIAAPEPRAALNAINISETHSPISLAYGDVFAAWMALAWFATAWATAALARSLQLSPWRALLLIAPAALYCAIQRYDPLPVFTLSAALLAFVHSKSKTGFLLLAAGTMLKIYPAAVFFLALGFVAKREGFKSAFAGALLFALAIAAMEAVPFIQGVLDPAWTAEWRPEKFAGLVLDRSPVSSGIAAVAVPFSYQDARDTNAGSLAERVFGAWRASDYNSLLAGVKTFRILQILPVIPAFFVGYFRPRPRTLVAASGVLVTTFVLFLNIYSPQFELWIVPLAAVAGGGVLGVTAFALAAASNVVTYVQFPMLAPHARFDAALQRNVYPLGFETAVDLRLALTILLILTLAILTFRNTPDDPDSPSA